VRVANAPSDRERNPPGQARGGCGGEGGDIVRLLPEARARLRLTPYMPATNIRDKEPRQRGSVAQREL